MPVIFVNTPGTGLFGDVTNAINFGFNPGFALSEGIQFANDAAAAANALARRLGTPVRVTGGTSNVSIESTTRGFTAGISSAPNVPTTVSVTPITERDRMANLPLSLGFTAPQQTGFGGFGGVSQPGIFSDLGAGLGSIISAFNPATPAAQTSTAQFNPPMAGNGGACCPTGPRLPTAFVADDPCGGSPRVYRNMGAVSSALMPGDFRAHRRVNKLASKARRPRARARKR